MTDISPALLELVDAGIEWANENLPDWREHVDPKNFYIMDGERCFLGQYWNSTHPGEVAPEDAYQTASDTYFGVSAGYFRCGELGFTIFLESWFTWDELSAAWQHKFRELGMLEPTNQPQTQSKEPQT